VNLQTSIIITLAIIKFAFFSILISVLLFKMEVILTDKTQYFRIKMLSAITLNKSTVFIKILAVSAKIKKSLFVFYYRRKLACQLKQRK
jgi:hypothetical protein